MINTQYIKKNFVLQHDSSDCGVACLRSILRFYEGDISLERLRELSGTSIQGTTLLGLYEAANNIGFDAEGCQADIVDLIQHGEPTILHVVVDDNQQHYIVWYGYEKPLARADILNKKDLGKHIVGDPAKGILELEDDELTQIWRSGKCLTLSPNGQFVKSTDQTEKRNKWFFNLIREDITLLIASSALGLLIATLGLVMALFSQKLVDDILPSKNSFKLVTGIILVSILLFVRIGLEILRTYILFRQSKGFNNRIITGFYDSLLNLPKSFFDMRKTGDIVARMNDTSRIQRVISQLVGQVLIDVLILFVSIGFLFSYSWDIGLGLLFCLPIYFALIYRFHKPITERQREVMINYASNESNFISTLSGIRPIKSLNRQSFFGKLNQTIYGRYQDSIFNLGIVQLRLNLLASVSGVVILVGILSYSSHLVLQRELKIGELMAVIGMSSSLLPSVANLALLAIPINEAKIAFERMFEFAGLPSEVVNELEDEESDFYFENLLIKDVIFRFPGKRAILNNLTFELHRGEIIGVAGESGCGKSTLIQLIERFYKPESGSICVNNIVHLNEIPISKWRQYVTCVPQDIHIFNGTVLDNILLGLETDSELIQAFFSKDPFRTVLDQFPQGLITLVGEEGINLSGGQKQWIGIMRALYQKPQILLLDEATSAMDTESEQLFLKFVKEISPDMGIVYISHRLHTLPSLCDRIYVLERNGCTVDGTHKSLLESNNLYSRFWNAILT